MDTKIIGKYTVSIDKDLCIGAGTCIAIAPSDFQLVDQKAVFLEGGETPEATMLMAAQSCPVKAVIIKETQTGEQVWPPKVG